MLLPASTPASSPQGASAQQQKSPGSQSTSRKKKRSSGSVFGCASPNKSKKHEQLPSSPSAALSSWGQARTELLKALEAFDGGGSEVTAALTALKAIASSKSDVAESGVARHFDVVFEVFEKNSQDFKNPSLKKGFNRFISALKIALSESAPAKAPTVKELIKQSLFTTTWTPEEARFFQTLRIHEPSSDPVTAVDCMTILTAMGVQEYSVWMQALLFPLDQDSALASQLRATELTTPASLNTLLTKTPEPESELKPTTDHNKTVGALAVVQPAGAAAAQPLPQMPQPNSLSSDKNRVVSDAVAQLTAKGSPEPGKAADALAVVSDGAASSAQQSLMNAEDLEFLPLSMWRIFSSEYRAAVDHCWGCSVCASAVLEHHHSAFLESFDTSIDPNDCADLYRQCTFRGGMVVDGGPNV